MAGKKGGGCRKCLRCNSKAACTACPSGTCNWFPGIGPFCYDTGDTAGMKKKLDTITRKRKTTGGKKKKAAASKKKKTAGKKKKAASKTTKKKTGGKKKKASTAAKKTKTTTKKKPTSTAAASRKKTPPLSGKDCVREAL